MSEIGQRAHCKLPRSASSSSSSASPIEFKSFPLLKLSTAGCVCVCAGQVAATVVSRAATDTVRSCLSVVWPGRHESKRRPCSWRFQLGALARLVPLSLSLHLGAASGGALDWALAHTNRYNNQRPRGQVNGWPVCLMGATITGRPSVGLEKNKNQKKKQILCVCVSKKSCHTHTHRLGLNHQRKRERDCGLANLGGERERERER